MWILDKITFNPRLEQVKFILIWEASHWQLVPQNTGSWEEAVRGELTSNHETQREHG